MSHNLKRVKQGSSGVVLLSYQLTQKNKPMKQCVALLFVLFLVACTPPIAEESFDVVLATQDSSAAGVGDAPPLLDLLGTEPDLVLFLNVLDRTGLLTQLQSGGPYTIFAPSNEAFTKIGMATTEIDPVLLQQVIAYHVTFGQMAATELGGTAESLASQPLTFDTDGAAIRVNGYATITQADIPIAEGVLHVVDSLLLPPEEGPQQSLWGVLVADGRFTTLVDLLAGSETMYALRFDTIDAYLAPTNDAFAKLDTATLDSLYTDAALRDMVFNKYYLLAPDGWPSGTPLLTTDIAQMDELATRVGRLGYRGEVIPITSSDGSLQLADASVVAGDLLATNGVVHGVDTAIIPQAALNPDS